MKNAPVNKALRSVEAIFARPGFLTAPGAIPEPARVVTDIQVAQRAATDQLRGWKDIRSREASRVLRHGQKHDAAAYEAARDALFSRVWDITARASPVLSRLPDDCRSFVEEDMWYIALHQVVVGAEARGFFPRMGAFYRAGWWPCGWDGRYPKGRFVAFSFPRAG